MTARDVADDLWSEIVRARDGACRFCGHRGGLNRRGLRVLGLDAAHIIRRGYSNTRVDLDNGIALCPICAGWFTEHHPSFLTWVVSKIGHDMFEDLVIRARATSRPDWAQEVGRLRQQLHRLARAA